MVLLAWAWVRLDVPAVCDTAWVRVNAVDESGRTVSTHLPAVDFSPFDALSYNTRAPGLLPGCVIWACD